MKLLEENAISVLFDVGIDSVFLVWSQARTTKANINKWTASKAFFFFFFWPEREEACHPIYRILVSPTRD